MCDELNEKLDEGKRLATALMEHMSRMGGASEATIPVSEVDDDGRLYEWEVTVTLKGVIDPAKSG